jgi:hypothetical protein
MHDPGPSVDYCALGRTKKHEQEKMHTVSQCMLEI